VAGVPWLDVEKRVSTALDNGEGLQADWLVLKVEGVTSDNCLSTSPEKPVDFIHLGYPGKTAGLVFSRGAIDNDSSEKCVDDMMSSFYPDLTKTDFNYASQSAEKIKEYEEGYLKYRPVAREVLDKIMNFGIFSSSLSLHEGMSGGPIVSENGRLIGINIGLSGQCERPGYGIGIQSIRRGMERLHLLIESAPTPDKIFSCK
jgi:hypothetical protein